MNKKTWLALGALILVLAIMVGIYLATRPQSEQPPRGEGKTRITVVVVHADGVEKTFGYETDEKYLDKVLVAEGLIPEGNIDSGMFTIVDGEEASWEKDKAYWSFYIGDQYATAGICDTVIEDGAVYKLVYAK